MAEPERDFAEKGDSMQEAGRSAVEMPLRRCKIQDAGARQEAASFWPVIRFSGLLIFYYCL
ncbi:MAG: hypothetical protein D6730_22500 [Bacteroidetes bacterium]|nr:MAG: hypothetical protein D6730_22500 [Bacteroidota bacterium]